MAVAVVVVNYKTYDLLSTFVESYHRVKFEGCTLTIVDVGASVTAFGHGDPTVDHDFYVSEQENIGYARACNLGAAFSPQNDVILLANADTLLSDGFKECYGALMAHDDWGVLGPRQVNEFNQITAGGIKRLGQGNQQRGWNEFDVGQFNDVFECPFISGSLMFIKRRVWKELTDCSFFKQVEPNAIGANIHTRHYFNDTWLGYHTEAHGYKNIFYGPVQMTHFWHKSSPVGGYGEQNWAHDQTLYRQACVFHGIQGE
jgi:hypothetical protein